MSDGVLSSGFLREAGVGSLKGQDLLTERTDTIAAMQIALKNVWAQWFLAH